MKESIWNQTLILHFILPEDSESVEISFYFCLFSNIGFIAVHNKNIPHRLSYFLSVHILNWMNYHLGNFLKLYLYAHLGCQDNLSAWNQILVAKMFFVWWTLKENNFKIRQKLYYNLILNYKKLTYLKKREKNL